jgi:F-type H+-transporting ATPase subunit b
MRIDVWTLVLQGINFLVLVWLLQRFLYKPVRAVIAKRKELAQAAFVEADKAKKDAEAAGAALEADRAKLAAEREGVLNAAHKSLEAERAKLIEDAKHEAERLVGEGHAAIAAEREAALAGLRKEIASLAAELAGRLLAETGVAADGDALLAAVTGRLAALAADERASLRKELTAEGARLTVVTAAPLSSDGAERWRARLAEALRFAGEIAFETDAALIGGAELRFPHAVLRLSWADWLAKAEAELAAQ